MTDYNWLYNSTQMVPDKQRIFSVSGNPIQVAAAGLQQCVDIYIAVGDCTNCGPGDVLWAPLASCGEVVQVCPDNNVIYLTIPGKYSFGDPNVPLTLTGDVNVRRTELTGLSNEQVAALSKKCSGPQDVNIVGPLPLPVDDAAGNVLLTSILAAITAKKDYEYKSNVVCNETTNTWHELTTVYVDGVAGASTSVDLGIPCDQPKPLPSDVEQIDYCDTVTNTIHKKIVRFDFPNPNDPTIVVEVVMSDTDTGLACEPITKTSISEVTVCAAGVTLTRKTRLESDGTEVVSFWGQNGTVVAAPAAYSIGACVLTPLRNFKIHMDLNTVALTVADIMTATGAAILHSITVKQKSGSGTITGDSGVPVPIDPGEFWSWSVVSDDNLDTLSTSLLTLDAGSGEQVITVIYLL